MRKVAFSSSPNRELTENSKNAPHIRRNSMLVGSLSTVLGSILLPPKRERDIILVHSTSAHQLPSKKSFFILSASLLLQCICNFGHTSHTYQEDEDFCQKRHGCSSHIFDVFVMDFCRKLEKGNCSINCAAHWGKRRNHDPHWHHK